LEICKLVKLDCIDLSLAHAAGVEDDALWHILSASVWVKEFSFKDDRQEVEAEVGDEVPQNKAGKSAG